jgi:hypothetical protein
MYVALASLRRRAHRLSSLAVFSVTLLAACDSDKPLAPKPATVPTGAAPQLIPYKTGTLVLKLVDQNQNIVPQLLPDVHARFAITGPTNITWQATDDSLPDTDPTPGMVVLKALVPGVYKACEISTPFGFGVVGQSCLYTQVFAGATSGLFFVHATEAIRQWSVMDEVSNNIGGTVFQLDSTNVTMEQIADDDWPLDMDPAAGKFHLILEYEAAYKVCLKQVPPGYVQLVGQDPCVATNVKMNTQEKLPTFRVVPTYSANWTVTDGLTLIGPATFKISKGFLKGVGDMQVVDNGVNDRDPALGKVAVALPAAGLYSVCETIPPANHWNAQPPCKTITVAAGMPMSPGTFINPEKQVYSPGPSGAR